MATTMLLHDRRLEGRTPRGYDFSSIVDQHTPLVKAISRVQACGLRRRIDSLHTFCHGLEGHYDLGLGISTLRSHGGFGLRLCREDLMLMNVGRTHVWRGLVRQIVLFACVAAETSGHNAGTRADGRRFCGELALWTGAEVIASSVRQQYTYIKENWWTRLFGADPLDFGEWEGPVFRFTPDHPEGQPCRPPRHDPQRPRVY